MMEAARPNPRSHFHLQHHLNLILPPRLLFHTHNTVSKASSVFKNTPFGLAWTLASMTSGASHDRVWSQAEGHVPQHRQDPDGTNISLDLQSVGLLFKSPLCPEHGLVLPDVVTHNLYQWWFEWSWYLWGLPINVCFKMSVQRLQKGGQHQNTWSSVILQKLVMCNISSRAISDRGRHRWVKVNSYWHCSFHVHWTHPIRSRLVSPESLNDHIAAIECKLWREYLTSAWDSYWGFASLVLTWCFLQQTARASDLPESWSEFKTWAALGSFQCSNTFGMGPGTRGEVGHLGEVMRDVGSNGTRAEVWPSWIWTCKRLHLMPFPFV